MSIKSGKLRRLFFDIIGTLNLGIGIIGIIVPVLPATPFFLLAAFCYMKGSTRLYNALLGNRFLGSYIKNYLQGKGMPVRMKIWTLSLLFVAIAYTALFVIDVLVIRIILAAVLSGVTIHIVKIKTLRKNLEEKNLPSHSHIAESP